MTEIPRYYTTGEIAELLGITRRTLHFYEEIGLVTPSEKGPNGQRLYTGEQVDQLEFVTQLKHLDLPLERIKQLLQMRSEHWQTPGAAAKEVTAFVSEILPLIDRRMRSLQKLYQDLLVGREVLHPCHTCTRQATPDVCRSCEVMHRDSLPQSLKALWLTASPTPAENSPYVTLPEAQS